MPTLSTCPRLVQWALGSLPGWPGWYYFDPTYCLYVTVSVTVTSLREAATGKRRDVHEALKPEAEALSPANPRDGAWRDWGVANFCRGETQKRRSRDRGAETELATSLKSKYVAPCACAPVLAKLPAIAVFGIFVVGKVTSIFDKSLVFESECLIFTSGRSIWICHQFDYYGELRMPVQLPYYISILRLFSFAFNFGTDDVSIAQAAKAYSILGIIKRNFIFMDEASYIVSSRNSWFV